MKGKVLIKQTTTTTIIILSWGNIFRWHHYSSWGKGGKPQSYYCPLSVFSQCIFVFPPAQSKLPMALIMTLFACIFLWHNTFPRTLGLARAPAQISPFQRPLFSHLPSIRCGASSALASGTWFPFFTCPFPGNFAGYFHYFHRDTRTWSHSFLTGKKTQRNDGDEKREKSFDVCCARMILTDTTCANAGQIELREFGFQCRTFRSVYEYTGKRNT